MLLYSAFHVTAYLLGEVLCDNKAKVYKGSDLKTLGKGQMVLVKYASTY